MIALRQQQSQAKNNMADYAIGDVQGCYHALQRLLTAIKFNPQTDKLWFVGDLVNRGPESLAVLRFLHTLPNTQITLGNHDLYLLYHLFVKNPTHQNAEDTLGDILSASDRESLGHWLRKQSVLIYSPELNLVMTHAGIAPIWTLPQAQQYAAELEQALRGDDFITFLENMFGNQPDLWSEELTGYARLRTICNYFTRMRFCDASGRLISHYKGDVKNAPNHTYPWYAVPNRCPIEPDIIFGHWAALLGKCPVKHIYALDTGCVWGNTLTALRLQDKQRFSVPAQI